jgi:hypothetical protein
MGPRNALRDSKEQSRTPGLAGDTPRGRGPRTQCTPPRAAGAGDQKTRQERTPNIRAFPDGAQLRIETAGASGQGGGEQAVPHADAGRFGQRQPRGGSAMCHFPRRPTTARAFEVCEALSD